VTPPADLDRALDAYAALIRRYAARINLVGDTAAPFLETTLIRGSLELARALPPGASLEGTLVDVGSGAGLPGIPLALAYPGLAVTLCEVRNKRLAFLERARAELGLSGLRIAEGGAEALPRDHFDWAVARAFEAPTPWMVRAARLVRPGGHVGVYASTAEWHTATVPPALALVGEAADETGPERVVAVLRRVG
jgi:16S rRNA (guanine527-N7)-methyltransferase